MGLGYLGQVLNAQYVRELQLFSQWWESNLLINQPVMCPVVVVVVVTENAAQIDQHPTKWVVHPPSGQSLRRWGVSLAQNSSLLE